MYRRDAVESLARVCQRHSDELDAAVNQVDDTPLTLSDAARLSGLSAEHLGRRLRQGTIPNAGRKGAPRIRRGDLPMKARKIERPSGSSYDIGADARSLAGRRKEQ